MADQVSSIKGLNDALKTTLKTLKDIDTTIKSMSTSFTKTAKDITGVINKVGTLNLGKGTGLGIGTSNASITTASFGSGQNQPVSDATQPASAAQQKNANNTAMPWMSPTAATFSILGGATQIAAGLGGAAYAMSPDLGTTVSGAANFYATSQYSPTGLGWKQIQGATFSALNGSFGRGVSSPTDLATAAAVLTQGYGYAPGSSPYLQAMNAVGGAYRSLNMSNGAAAQAIGGFAAQQTGATLYQMGISTYDSKGNPIPQAQIAQQLYSRIFRPGSTATQVQKDIMSGNAGIDIQNLGFSQDQQDLLKLQFNLIAQGKNPDLAKLSGSGNPATAQQTINTSNTKLMIAAQQSMIDGFNKAASTIKIANDEMAKFGQTAFEAKGYLQGLGQSGVGGALSSAVTGFSVGLKNILEGFATLLAAEKLGVPMGPVASKLTGFAKDAVEVSKAAGITGGVALGATTLGASVAGGAAGGQVASVNKQVLSRAGVNRTVAHAGGVALGVGVGAATGLAIGSALAPFTFGASAPIGAAVGAFAGGVAALFRGGSSYGGFGASFGAKGGGSTPPQTGVDGSLDLSVELRNAGSSQLPTLSSPVPGVAPTTMYGAKDPGMWNGAKNYHTGDDYAIPVGTSVKAVAAGTVMDDAPGADFGVYVQIDHGNGYQTLYGHLQSKSVKLGQQVKAGQEIGKSGQSGNVTGPHLHFEVRKGHNNPVDPASFLTGTASGTSAATSTATSTSKSSATPTVGNSGNSSTSSVGKILGTGSMQTWAKTLLRKLNAPLTKDNIAALTTWAAHEGGHWHNPDHYNPLDTTLPMPGSIGTNKEHVQSYTSWEQGYQATVDTLTNTKNRGYDKILADLRSGKSSFSKTFGDISNSGWVSGAKGQHSYGGGNSGFGASIVTASALGGGSASVTPTSTTPAPKNITITLNIQKASDEEAIRFAKKVYELIQDKEDYNVMGRG